MIEREFVKQKKKEFQVQEFVASELSRVGHSKTKMQRTPLGEKIIIHASRPGLIVGRKGANIKALTKSLKRKFKLDNPQIEIAEVQGKEKTGAYDNRVSIQSSERGNDNQLSRIDINKEVE